MLVETQHLLERTRLRLSEGWARGLFATTATGLPVSPNSGLARRFCAIGGLQSFGANDDVVLQAQATVGAQAKRLYGIPSAMTVNDRLGKQAVLRCFDAAIAQIRAQREAELDRQLEAMPVSVEDAERVGQECLVNA